MKSTSTLSFINVSSCLLLLAAWASTTACAQGTAFTYQGRLNVGGGPANGTYDFQFRLAADPLANSYIGNPFPTNGILVTNGLFFATVDFGPGILNGSNYWLEVDVRTNGAGSYTPLTPLQPLTPAPYAVFANSSSNLLGVLPAGQLSGTVGNGNLPASPTFTTVTATTFAGSGVNVSNVNAQSLNGLSSTNFWQLGGNNVGSGQILGSTNNQPVEVWVNGARTLRLEPGAAAAGAPNVIGGSSVNFVGNGVAGAMIGGGGTTNSWGGAYTNRVLADFGVIAGGADNLVPAGSSFSTVGGGNDNTAGGTNTPGITVSSTVAGGAANTALAPYASIGGGVYNTNAGFASANGGGFENFIQTNGQYATLSGGLGNVGGSFASTIAGGQLNHITNNANYETIGGGYENVVLGFAGTVPGGRENVAGTYSFAAGFDAQATNFGSFVWADFSGFEVPFGSLKDNSFSVRAVGGARFVTSGAGMTVDGFPVLISGGGSGITIQQNSSGSPNVIEGSPYNFAGSGVLGATIGGGGSTNYSGQAYTNSVIGHFGTVGGGAKNVAGFVATVAGGGFNSAVGQYATVGGGDNNTNDSEYATIAGGIDNTLHGAGSSFIGGGYLNSIWGPGGVQDDFNVIGGGEYNFETNVVYSFIGGGLGNTNYTSYAVIGGGNLNLSDIYARYSVIGGGQNNIVSSNSDHTVVGGGMFNFVQTNSSFATMSGGTSNYLSGTTAAIGGGYGNHIEGPYSTVGGGYWNTNYGTTSIIAGGSQNTIAVGAAASVIGGGGANRVAGNGGIVAGGIYNWAGVGAAVVGGDGNAATGLYSFVGGGGDDDLDNLNGNYATGPASTIAGGDGNYATNRYATVPGGANNTAGGISSFAAGQNAQALHQGAFVWSDSELGLFPSTANDQFSVRARGGVRFVTSGAGMTVDGFPLLTSGGSSGIAIQNNSDGEPNIVMGSPANFVAGGVEGATISGGGTTNYNGIGTVYANSVTGEAGTVAGGQGNSAGEYSTVGGGILNTNNSNVSAIGGGLHNDIEGGGGSVIGGGGANHILSSGSGITDNTIAGGSGNCISNILYGSIGGGFGNTNMADGGVIAGGRINSIAAFSLYSAIAGGEENVISNLTRYAVIGGGFSNYIHTNSHYSTISGGVNNFISGSTQDGTIGGGTNNFVNGIAGTVAGGENNSASAFRDTVAGGTQNTASGGISTVSGGWTNVASGNASAIGGGDHNLTTGVESVISGGAGNQATGNEATVPGGLNNIAQGLYSFAAGQQAQALHQGAFVWADSQPGVFSSTMNDEFSIRATNGVRIQADKGIHLNANDRPIIVRDWDTFGSTAPSYKAGIGRWGLFMEPTILTIGIPSNDVPNRFFQIAKYATNGTYTTLVLVDQAGDLYATNNVFAKGVQLTSDRNAKEHFTPLNPENVLAKVAAMPVTQWNYKSDDAETKHIGPVAQDFHQAFGLNGDDDRHISAVDESGVALAAIQGLNQRVDELKTENAELKQRLAALEKLIQDRK